MDKLEYKKIYGREYRKRPDVKAKKVKYDKEYNKRPEVIERRKKVAKEYAQSGRLKEKSQSPDRKSKQWEIHLKVKYNLTVEEWDEIFAEQNFVCAICKGSSTRMQVDHCHSTGKVRGILCPTCNIALGYFELYRSRLENLLSYLDR